MIKIVNCLNYCYVCVLLILVFATQIKTGPNNLHMHDAAYSADIIGGDIFFEIIEPSELEYTYRIRPAKDFGASFNDSFRIEKVRLVPVIPKYCCSVPENIEEIAGHVALIERGECSFKKKTIIAEKFGAKAVIITDLSKVEEDYFIEMVDDETKEEAHIPAGFLMGKNGFIIRKTLRRLKRNYALINLPVNLTFTNLYDFNLPPWLEWY